jgi:uncharacterized protein
MSGPWFSFTLTDFSYSFLSILFEGIPFILFGTLLSGVIDQFLPARVMTRLIPRNPAAGICVSALMGLVFPICECGIVPVIRRLVAKGLPVSSAVAYMLAAPIVNPITAISTYAAFRGQGPEEITTLRLSLGFFVAALAGFAVLNLPLRSVLKKSVLDQCGDVDSHSLTPHAPFTRRLASAMHSGTRDFLDVAVYFVLGVAVTSLFGTSINQEIFLPLALNETLAIPAMMTLAGLLSLCSSSDAFIAATFVSFPAVAKLAFLVIGPMVDLKLLFVYSLVFTRRFVAGVAVGLFLLVALLALRLGIVFQ